MNCRCLYGVNKGNSPIMCLDLFGCFDDSGVLRKVRYRTNGTAFTFFAFAKMLICGKIRLPPMNCLEGKTTKRRHDNEEIVKKSLPVQTTCRFQEEHFLEQKFRTFARRGIWLESLRFHWNRRHDLRCAETQAYPTLKLSL